MTSGGDTVTNGWWRLHWRTPAGLTAMAFAVIGFVYMLVNATTLIDQRAALGVPIEPWRAWLLELTSLVGWMLLLPPILWLAARLAGLPKRWLAIACHVAACLAASLMHSLLMLSLRLIGFHLVGSKYETVGPLNALLLFELRKDAITYGAIVICFLIARRLTTQPKAAPVGNRAAEALIEIRDGSRTFWLRPDEVDWISAAGNYVELHGPFGTRLSRRPISDIEAQLSPHGFKRIHRSRLVRQASITAVETRQSGDFEIRLRCGTTISGSRRYRSNLRPD